LIDRTERLTRVPALLRLFRGGQRAVGVHQHEGVHLVVVPIDRLQRGLSGLDRREFLSPIRLDEVRRRRDHHGDPAGI
jgi:hypothetical protein